jgi:hypothetical protein
LRAGSITDGLLLPGSVPRDEYANKYQKALLFPPEPRKNRKSLRGAENGTSRPGTRCCGWGQKQLSDANLSSLCSPGVYLNVYQLRIVEGRKEVYASLPHFP